LPEQRERRPQGGIGLAEPAFAGDRQGGPTVRVSTDGELPQT